MSDIRIYTESSTGHTFFLGTTVPDIAANLLQADAEPNTFDRVRIWKTDRIDTNEYLFKKLDMSRLQNQSGQYLVDVLGFDQTAIVDYLNNSVFTYIGGGVGQIQDLTGATGADGVPAAYNIVVVDKSTGEVKTIPDFEYITPEEG